MKKAKWRLVLLSAPIGIVLAMFQNCGQNTRQVRVSREISTPGTMVTEKALDVLSFGTKQAHLDLSDALSTGSELTIEMTSYADAEGPEFSPNHKSKNLRVYPLSLEGICPSPITFYEAPDDNPASIQPGSGYLIMDTATHKFAYLLLTGFTGEAKDAGRELSLIQMSFNLVAPQPGIDFDRFLTDICGEPPLALGPGLK